MRRAFTASATVADETDEDVLPSVIPGLINKGKRATRPSQLTHSTSMKSTYSREQRESDTIDNPNIEPTISGTVDMIPPIMPVSSVQCVNFVL